GAIFVEELDEVPDGATVIFSAHGVSQAVRLEAERRGLKVFDATCPLVTKVHLEVARHCRQGRDVVLIGHAGHPEVEGTMGQWKRECGQGRIYLVESVEDAARLELAQPDNCAYATQNRQDAVRVLAGQADLVLVVGSANSSNSNRLRELAQREGVQAHLIDGAADIRPEWLAGKARIGVTAGASAPEVLVQEVIARLRELGADGGVHDLAGEPENMVFALPKELRIQLLG